MTPRERLRRKQQSNLALQARPPGRVFIRVGQVLLKTGLATSSLYDLIAQGAFPAPVPLSERRVAWLLDEVEAWIEARVKDRDQRDKIKARSEAALMPDWLPMRRR
jgi:prophage regulatory protein